MKKLLITSTDLMMIQFLVPHVRYLSQKGFQVEIACSEVGGRMEEVRQAVAGFAKVHTLRLVRSPFSPENRKGYRDMVKLLGENHYDIIWTNEPVMGVVTRLAARKHRKSGTKVVYMCHGFHFYRGAPLPNWLIYYPVERCMSRFCDAIVTINHEDEARARTFHCPRVEHIHGIGVDAERLHPGAERTDIRRELGLKDDDFLVLSVGELNKNKNQQVILRALAELHDDHIHYLLCGKGDCLEALQRLARELGLEKNVHFLGYRRDVVDICTQADVFAHPSKREGLPLALMEAMYCGLPVICSRIRGNTDLIDEPEGGILCDPEDAAGFADAIQTLRNDLTLRHCCGQRNREAVKPFCVAQVKDEILHLLQSLT